MNDLILGVCSYGHDSSACLINSKGEILYCLTEERFSNIKHDGNFPTACLDSIDKKIKEKNLGKIKYVGLNNKPDLFITEKLSDYIYSALKEEEADYLMSIVFKFYPQIVFWNENVYPTQDIIKAVNKCSLSSKEKRKIIRRMKWCINRSLSLQIIKKNIQLRYPHSIVLNVPHHECHTASAFYTSGYDNAAILSCDGAGEHDTIVLSKASDKTIETLSSTRWPHSIGMLYCAFTTFLGFSGFGDEFKVMGMSAYGNPSYNNLFDNLGYVAKDGTLHLNTKEFICDSEIPWFPGESTIRLKEPFKKALGGTHKKGEPFKQRHFDIACSLQNFVEKIGVDLAKALKRMTPETKSICIAGGVGLNGLMNQRILKEAGFENIYIQPASTDDGTSLGAALHILHKHYKNITPQRFNNMFMGLDYAPDLIQETLDKTNIKFSTPNNLPQKVATLLSEGYVVARYEGCSEFGPRALGHRSIMASPLSADMKDVLNARIKHREPFRPFAPACLAEEVENYFDANDEAEYMLLICKVKDDKKELIPAIVHEDGTARVQAVQESVNKGFYDIIKSFKEITNVPIIINTSFNVNGEAIVETPLDALECFLYTDIDYLIMEDKLIAKKDNMDKRLIMDSNDFLTRRKQRYLDHFITDTNEYEQNLMPLGGVLGGISNKDVLELEVEAQEESCLAIINKAKELNLTDTCIASAGYFGQLLYKTAKEQKFPIAFLTDSIAENVGKEYDGTPIVLTPHAIESGQKNFLVPPSIYEEEIIDNLYGFAEKFNKKIKVVSLADTNF